MPRTKKAGKPKADRANKKGEVIARRAKGATLAEIMKATGWQAHTGRGFVSLLGSKGGAIESGPGAAADALRQGNRLDEGVRGSKRE